MGLSDGLTFAPRGSALFGRESRESGNTDAKRQSSKMMKQEASDTTTRTPHTGTSFPRSTQLFPALAYQVAYDLQPWTTRDKS
eukprot:scaffold34661_cov54-Attheya_sp.AAC.3